MIHIYWQANPNRPGSQGMCVFKYASLRVNYLTKSHRIQLSTYAHWLVALGEYQARNYAAWKPTVNGCQQMSTDSLADVLTCWHCNWQLWQTQYHFGMVNVQPICGDVGDVSLLGYINVFAKIRQWLYWIPGKQSQLSEGTMGLPAFLMMQWTSTTAAIMLFHRVARSRNWGTGDETLGIWLSFGTSSPDIYAIYGLMFVGPKFANEICMFTSFPKLLVLDACLIWIQYGWDSNTL